jgi:hypothetical protein
LPQFSSWVFGNDVVYRLVANWVDNWTLFDGQPSRFPFIFVWKWDTLTLCKFIAVDLLHKNEIILIIIIIIIIIIQLLFLRNGLTTQSPFTEIQHKRKKKRIEQQNEIKEVQSEWPHNIPQTCN